MYANSFECKIRTYILLVLLKTQSLGKLSFCDLIESSSFIAVINSTSIHIPVQVPQFIFLFKCLSSYFCSSASVHIPVQVPQFIFLVKCLSSYSCSSASVHIPVQAHLFIFLFKCLSSYSCSSASVHIPSQVPQFIFLLKCLSFASNIFPPSAVAHQRTFRCLPPKFGVWGRILVTITRRAEFESLIE